MSVINKIFAYIDGKRQERNNACDELVARFSHANSAADMLVHSDDFTDITEVDIWCNKSCELMEKACENSFEKLKRAKNYKRLKSETDVFHTNIVSLRGKVLAHNNEVAEKKIPAAYSLIGNVEGRRLDSQQMLCIVKESHNHLVIAGAGTGKTTTVVGKIKYLLKSGKYNPEDILVLSFTNASASEMSERIEKETGCKIFASTFHKLGLSIIAKSDGIKPKITQINLNAFIKNRLLELINNPEYLKKLNSYIMYYGAPYKSEFEFSNKKEYDDYLKLNPPVTFLKEKVKSYGEKDIANCLYENGIRYEYEAEYKFDTRTEDYAQYHPDFYLPDYDIYIEYFGVNKHGEVPDWFFTKGGKSATDTYRESMEWKFKTHKKNHTKLIAVYAYEKVDGTLLPKLKTELEKYEVKFSPKSPEEMWKCIQGNGDSPLDGLIELFETVINLLKSNSYSIEYFLSLTRDNGQKDFVSLVKPLLEKYSEELKNNGEIDFNDMINLAAEYIRSGKAKNPFSYVIVDEYQDISKARYNLLVELRKSKNFDLFCVGDDWQSIYRFAGSDINYILDFKKYWGGTTIDKIETTYRFTKSLIEISGNFITQNPSQIKKQIKGKSADTRFSMGEISGYTEKKAVEFMSVKLEDLPKNASVFFIGRYSFDVKLLSDSGIFSCQYNNATGFTDVKYGTRADLKMCFMTAHKSKGLQADYVFIINNRDSKTGFPSQIQDNPILDLLLDGSERFPFAEERRLYYVALTRAKVKAYMLVRKDHESVFAQELHERYEKELKSEAFECPLCGGILLRKTGPYGEFFGCENYITTGCRYKRKITRHISYGEHT